MADEIEHPKKRAFLAAYATLGVVTHAAKAAQVGRGAHYEWMNRDGDEGEQYRAAFAIAKREANDSLEVEARRRAIAGVDKPVYFQGERIDTIKTYSDTLLIFLMKAADPKRFRDNYQQPQETPNENSQPGLDLTRLLATVRKELQSDGQYIDYLRSRACDSNGNAGSVGGNGHAKLEDGPPLGRHRPGANGNGNGHVKD